MRLLLITKDFPPDVGGIQSYCWELAHRFVASCEAFCVVAPRLPGSAEVDARAPFPVHRVACTRNTFAALSSLHLPALHRRYGFDTVLGAQWQTALPALAASSLVHRPRVFAAVHGREILTRHYAKLPGGAEAFHAARRATLERVDAIFPVSHYALALVQEQGIPYRRAAVVPNGCDPERYRPADGSAVRTKLGLGERPTLLTLGRLVPRKGVDTVLRALPAIQAAVPEVVYLVGGAGPDEARLKALASELGLDGCVRFLGRVPDDELLATYGAADLFVLAAREERPDVEGFGLVYLEANACGKAVVGTTSGGVPDAVVPGKTGLLVAPDDALAFARAVIELLSDPARARAMGEAGRVRVQREATWDRVASTLFREMSGPQGVAQELQAGSAP
jgi:phosphatidylinositol alpha-1,6-mannosyltransferase